MFYQRSTISIANMTKCANDNMHDDEISLDWCWSVCLHGKRGKLRSIVEFSISVFLQADGPINMYGQRNQNIRVQSACVY